MPNANAGASLGPGARLSLSLRTPRTEKRAAEPAISTYALDGRGKRSVKVAGTARTFTIFSGTNIISEFSDASTATYTPGTTPGQAPADTVSSLLYQHQDHLTTRLVTDQRSGLGDYKGHYPFGDSWYESGQASPSVERKFTRYD